MEKVTVSVKVNPIDINNGEVIDYPKGEDVKIEYNKYSKLELAYMSVRDFIKLKILLRIAHAFTGKHEWETVNMWYSPTIDTYITITYCRCGKNKK